MQAPEPAFISSLGRWPPLDRWRLCGQSARIRLMMDQAGPQAPRPSSISRTDPQQRKCQLKGFMVPIMRGS
jgi:hypothetical protein